MTTTMKSINHAAPITGAFTADMAPVVKALGEMTKALRESADRPPAELRVPLPEIHNEIVVKPPSIEYYAPAVDNGVTVNVSPTPVEVRVEPANFQVDSPHIEINLGSLVRSVYVLSGVIGGAALGIIASLLMR